MALNNYSGLVAGIAGWLDRDDLAPLIPNFIELAEAKFNERLRMSPMESAATLNGDTITLPTKYIVDEMTGTKLTDEDTSGDDLTYIVDDVGGVTSIALPTDILEFRFVLANTSPQIRLRLAEPGWSIDAYADRMNYPDVYTILHNRMHVYPATASSITLIYYERIPALSPSRETNWLIDTRPNIYLYGALLESAPVLGDDNRVVLWKSALEESIELAREADMALRWGNATLRLSGPTP